MFYGTFYFNQDLTSWNVSSVNDCRGFTNYNGIYSGAILEKANYPNFSECDPD